MSLRNPLHIYRDIVIGAANRAYHVKKIRNTMEMAIYVRDEIKLMLSDKLNEQMALERIINIIGNRFERLLDEGSTLDLFHDLDFQITFGRGTETYQRELGDLDYEHALLFRRRKQSHMEKMAESLKEFDRVWTFIGPLLKANPDWLWRDAITYLEANGGIPAE
jgi:hypothetical protein